MDGDTEHLHIFYQVNTLIILNRCNAAINSLEKN